MASALGSICRRGTQGSQAESRVGEDRLHGTDLPHQERFPPESTSSFGNSLGIGGEDPDQVIAMNEGKLTERQLTFDLGVDGDFSLEHVLGSSSRGLYRALEYHGAGRIVRTSTWRSRIRLSPCLSKSVRGGAGLAPSHPGSRSPSPPLW